MKERKTNKKSSPRHVECEVCGKTSRTFILATRDRILSQAGWKLTGSGWVCSETSCKKASKGVS